MEHLQEVQDSLKREESKAISLQLDNEVCPSICGLCTVA